MRGFSPVTVYGKCDSMSLVANPHGTRSALEGDAGPGRCIRSSLSRVRRVGGPTPLRARRPKVALRLGGADPFDGLRRFVAFEPLEQGRRVPFHEDELSVFLF